ncbi:MAG: collagen-like protein [Ruminococcus sp.]|nr:collagen-like protein [Ruminococcus sp.]
MYSITLDLQKATTQYFLNTVKGDLGISIEATFTNFAESDSLSGKTVMFSGVKTDGTVLYEPTVISGNKATYTDSAGQLCTELGIVKCSFIVTDGNTVKYSPQLFVVVNANVGTDLVVKASEDSLSALTLLYTQMRDDYENGRFKGDTGATGPQGPKGDKGDKGDSGTGIVSTNSFDNSVDPNLIYKVNRSGAQYLMFVIRSSTAITQWRYQPKDASNNQTANIEVRYGTVRTAGGNEIVDFGSNQWVPLTDVLNLCTNTGADTKIAAAVSGKANAATTLAGYGITDGMKLTVETTGTTIPTTLNQGQFYTNGGKVFLKNNESFKVANHLQLAAIGDVPTKTSDLINDSGFLTSHQDISGKMDLAPEENNPSNYETITQGQLFKSQGAYFVKESTGQTQLAKRNDIPTVPTNVSAFQNDVGYLTDHQDISGKQDKQTSVPEVPTTEYHGSWIVDTSSSEFLALSIGHLFHSEFSEVLHTYQKTGEDSYIELSRILHEGDLDSVYDMIGNIEMLLSQV